MDLECLNEEDLNEPNITIRRVNERSDDSAPRESVLHCLDVLSEIECPGPRLLFAHLNIRFGDSSASWEIVGSLSPTEDRWPGKAKGLVTGVFSVFPECPGVFGDRCDLCSP
ncbi:hypothetical protein CDL15_Pgr011650 [Punica granatum]|uniref:Uncharacterized protein n=1 Tax=Punica granatum TaxID=22663 RepID=A0A218XGB1_PUNGR|nr:hypothetical protein CDL15_Pgr011650 [Punica granatum]